jgi:inosine-uridine nucleoside N-ribohydrolase
MAQKIIIDTDPGIDDAMAIHLAFADQRLEVLGLTTIFGNVWIEQATRNALFLAEQAAYPVAVAEGAAVPRMMPPNPPSHYVHGVEGFGDMLTITPKTSADPRPAHQYISETCRAYPHEIVLCPVGPLTNIARLLDEDPEITTFVKKLVIMGGAVGVAGNVTPHAEANIWNDPHAADCVFAADWPIELIGLNVTDKIRSTPRNFAHLAEKAPIIGQFINEISAFYIRFYETVTSEAVCLMHDPAAVLSITDPDLFTYEAMPLEVALEGAAIGQTIVSGDLSRRQVMVAVAADCDKIIKTYLDICGECDKMRDARVLR